MTDMLLMASMEALQKSIEEQNRLTKRLIEVTAENSQELLELRQAMAKPKAAVKSPTAPPSGVQRRS